MSLFGLVLSLVILFVLIWAIQTLSGAFGVPQPISLTIIVLLVLLFVIRIVQMFGGSPVIFP